VNFEDVERSLIMQAMDRTDNNITKSAKLLGLTFRTLQYRLEKFGIKKDGDGTGKKKRRNDSPEGLCRGASIEFSRGLQATEPESPAMPRQQQSN
jgi:hypothetical protein